MVEEGDVPTLNIKNQRVYELARKLSERTGQSMTSVIETALERELAALDHQRGRTRAQRMAELEQLVQRTAPVLADLPADPFAELYDERTGLPR